MGAGYSETQAGLAARHGWIADGRNEKALIPQGTGSFNRLGFVADRNGNDCRRAFRVLSFEFRAEFRNAFPQQSSALLAGVRLDETASRGGGCSGSRHGRGGENEGSGAIDEILNERARTTNVSPGCAQGLAQGAHLDLDAVAHAEVLTQAAPIGA